MGDVAVVNLLCAVLDIVVAALAAAVVAEGFVSVVVEALLQPPGTQGTALNVDILGNFEKI